MACILSSKIAQNLFSSRVVLLIFGHIVD
jgi:hypothetical protein